MLSINNQKYAKNMCKNTRYLKIGYKNKAFFTKNCYIYRCYFGNLFEIFEAL